MRRDLLAKSSITSIIQKTGITITPRILFDADYRNLNMLMFLSQKAQEVRKEIDAIRARLPAAAAAASAAPADDDSVLANYSNSFNSRELHELLTHRNSCDAELAETDQDGLDQAATAAQAARDAFREAVAKYHIPEKTAEEIIELEKKLIEIEKELTTKIQLFETAYNDAASGKLISAWQSVMYQAYCNNPDEDPSAALERDAFKTTPGGFLKFVLRTHERFFPHRYIPYDRSLPYEMKFPSSGYAYERHASGLAHFQPCTGHYDALQSGKKAGLLASCAPPKSDSMDDSINHNQLQTFLTMLFDSNVEHILELGADTKKVRLDYHTVDSGKFTAKQVHANLVVTNTETGERKIIGFSHFGVEDQKPLTLSNEEAKTLLSIHEKYQQGTVLVHCDSGVGRTGQVALLFAFRNWLSNNPSVRNTLHCLIDSIITGASIDSTDTEKFIQMLYAELHNILNQLRRVRYTVESKEQFLTSLGLAFLMEAISINHYTDEDINKLRAALGVQIVQTASAAAATAAPPLSTAQAVSEGDSDDNASALLSPRNLTPVENTAAAAAATQEEADAGNSVAATAASSSAIDNGMASLLRLHESGKAHLCEFDPINIETSLANSAAATTASFFHLARQRTSGADTSVGNSAAAAAASSFYQAQQAQSAGSSSIFEPRASFRCSGLFSASAAAATSAPTPPPGEAPERYLRK